MGKMFFDFLCFKFDGDGYYFILLEEICVCWDKEVLGVCDIILWIVECVGDYFNVWKYYDWMFNFDILLGYDVEVWFCYEVKEGFEWCFFDGVL